MFDVIIIGGSYAGISAAMPLARARRKVLVLDAGRRRNAPAAHAHGFLGQDGVDPAVIAARGKAEVLAYPTVTWRDEEATAVRRDASAFIVATASGGEERARRIVLATGITDELPPVSGVRERFARTVFHCPYCHGYELDRGAIGVLATSEHSVHQAILASEWAAPGETTLFLAAASGPAIEPTAVELADLERRAIRLERTPVVAVEGAIEGHDARAIVCLEGGRAIDLAGLFVATRMRVMGPFAESLGCAIESHLMGSYYRTDPMTKETSAPGVFACGDAGVPMGALPFAVADGFKAGVGAHRSLVLGN